MHLPLAMTFFFETSISELSIRLCEDKFAKRAAGSGPFEPNFPSLIGGKLRIRPEKPVIKDGFSNILLVRPVAFVYKVFSIAVDVLVPVGFVIFVFLRHSVPFPSWAKGLGVGAGVVGLAAAALRLSLPYYRELGLTADDYVAGMRLSRTLSGVFIGIVISIVVACMRTKPRESANRPV